MRLFLSYTFIPPSNEAVALVHLVHEGWQLETCWLDLALLHSHHGRLITTIHLWLKPSFFISFFMFILILEDGMARYGLTGLWDNK